MRIAVLSGKGGAGKTFVAVNLAATSNHATYIDCDVEEPHGRLFLKPENCREIQVTTRLPLFDEEKCSGCRKCLDFCRFNALVYTEGKPMVIPEACHACGGCAMVCPSGAITEGRRRVGVVERGRRGSTDVVTGFVNTGEISPMPVVKATLKAGLGLNDVTMIDCPPGSGAAVVESITASDGCILVAEPTAFGFYNFQMVHRLVQLLNKPCFVVINKEEAVYQPLGNYCVQRGIPVMAHIPFNSALIELCAHGKVACLEQEQYRSLFQDLLDAVSWEVRP